MCVAAIVNNPVPLSDLELMEQTNPHGGGVGWLDKRSGKFRYIKGITAKDIHGMQEAGVMSYPYLLHFRWATHGPQVPQLCHPFPIGVKALYDESSGEADSIMMHNGTWYAYDKWMPEWLPKQVQDNLSDTAVAAYVAAYFPEILDELSWATARADINGDGEISIALTGSWDLYEQNKYSNLHWRPSSRSGYYSDSNWWETWRGREWRSWVSEGKKEASAIGAREYWQDLADDDGGEEKTRSEYGSFSEYVEAKYGPNVARLAMDIDPEGKELSNSELESMALSDFNGVTSDDLYPHEDDDLISEDKYEVNEWLSRQVERSRL